MRSHLEVLLEAIVYDISPPPYFLKKKPGLSPKVQIQIYAHAYKKRLLSILEEDFPLTRKRLGKKKFREFAEAFIKEQPPKTNDLAAYSLLFAKSLRHKHNQLSADILKLIMTEATELELVEMEFLPPFQPSADMTEEQLLAIRLIPQPASIFVGNDFHYRLGGKLFHHPLSKAEAEALQELVAASSLAEWIDNLPPASARQVLKWLSEWIMHGMVCLEK